MTEVPRGSTTRLALGYLGIAVMAGGMIGLAFLNMVEPSGPLRDYVIVGVVTVVGATILALALWLRDRARRF